MKPVTDKTDDVDRCNVFASKLVEIRDNRCQRHDAALSGDTQPLPFHEICFPRSGLWLRHIGRKALPVDANYVHLLNRGEVHRVEHPIGCGDRNTGIVLDELVLREVSAAIDPRSDPEAPFRVTHFPVDGQSFALHCQLRAAAFCSAEEPLMVEELALELVNRILRRAQHKLPWCSSRTSCRTHRDLAAAARSLVADRLDERLTLGDLAGALQVSSFHLCRVFRQQTGCSLGRYRLQLRLREAMQLLVDSRDSLDLIAVSTGFADRSHLSRSFAKEFRMSPTSFRQGLAR